MVNQSYSGIPLPNNPAGKPNQSGTSPLNNPTVNILGTQILHPTVNPNQSSTQLLNGEPIQWGTRIIHQLTMKPFISGTELPINPTANPNQLGNPLTIYPGTWRPNYLDSSQPRCSGAPRDNYQGTHDPSVLLELYFSTKTHLHRYPTTRLLRHPMTHLHRDIMTQLLRYPTTTRFFQKFSIQPFGYLTTQLPATPPLYYTYVLRWSLTFLYPEKLQEFDFSLRNGLSTINNTFTGWSVLGEG